MTIRYKTTDLSMAMEYMRIHLRDKYFVSAYKNGIEYIVQVSGLEEVKTEPQTMYYPQVDGITPSVIAKDEPQTDYKMPYKDCEDCETHLKAQMQDRKDEPQTEPKRKEGEK